ncbi:MAG: nitrogen regulatory protein PII [Rhodothermales bacterium]|jgi:nitrogen regulatory protein PII
MKQVVAYIRSEQLPAVKRALADAEIHQFTAVSALGTAPNTERQMFRGVEREISLTRRVRVMVAVPDTLLETCIAAITQGAKESGGWGIIFVTELLDVINITTGERGSAALH